MSLDLYREEIDNRLASLRPATEPEPGMFDNFLVGTGKVAMQTIAKYGRAASMAVAPLAMAFEKEPGSTEVQDRFFKAHDDIFGNAVDYWTPKPGEVGAAGQVVGQLLGTLPLVLASPAATVAATQLSTGEDLVRKGVDAGKAQAVGGVQAAGLGLGIWVPILGQTLAQRVLLGGAGFNVAQGLATRAASAELLEGTPGAEDFKALDPTALTLDVLLGAAFGGIAHINPRMRAEGDAWHAKLKEWGAKLKPSEVDALATLRQAQHLNADSLPGKPVDVEDVNAHVARMRQALDDLANDRPVNVEDMPAGRFEPDAARRAEAEEVVDGWVEEAGPLPEPAKVSHSDTANKPKHSPEQMAKWAAEKEARIQSEIAKNEKIRKEEAERQRRSKGGPPPAFWSEFTQSEKSDIDGYSLSGDKQGANAEGRYAAVSVIERSLRSAGIEIEHVSDSRSSKSLYAKIGNDTVRISDHELPMTPERTHNREQGLTGKWDREVIVQDWRTTSLDDYLREIGAPSSENKRLGYVATDLSQRASSLDGGGNTLQPDASGRQLDPLAASAARFAAENPDLPIVIGKNADGSDITTTPRQWLEDADAAMRQAQDDASLFEIAAGCLLGGGR